jgi:hypothetical protein
VERSTSKICGETRRERWRRPHPTHGGSWLQAAHPSRWWKVANVDTLANEGECIHGRHRFINDTVPVLMLPDNLIKTLKATCSASMASAKARAGGGTKRAASLWVRSDRVLRSSRAHVPPKRFRCR